jgi:Chalcone isomerase-like
MSPPDRLQRRSVLTQWSGVVLALWTVGLPATATAQSGPKVYEGQTFDRQLVVAGSALQLNGTGMRQVAWFKGYLAALYLNAKASSAEQAVAASGPKRIQLRILVDVPAEEFSKAVRKGVLRNAAESSRQLLVERLDRFVRLIDGIGKVKKNDVINLDYEPQRGLVVYVNSAIRGEPILGEDFYSALLLSFVGEHPYDDKMRAGLLGKSI